jgi:hypothetical protein
MIEHTKWLDIFYKRKSRSITFLPTAAGGRVGAAELPNYAPSFSVLNIFDVSISDLEC